MSLKQEGEGRSLKQHANSDMTRIQINDIVKWTNARILQGL